MILEWFAVGQERKRQCFGRIKPYIKLLAHWPVLDAREWAVAGIRNEASASNLEPAGMHHNIGNPSRDDDDGHRASCENDTRKRV